MLKFTLVLLALLLLVNFAPTKSAEVKQQQSTKLLQPYPKDQSLPKTDWLLDGSKYKASVYRGKLKNELVLSNGLLRRTFRISPNLATIGLDNLLTGQSILRGVKPEATIKIDGTDFEIGGLTGQPNYAFLTPKWLDQLKANPRSFQFTGFEIGKPKPRLKWKRVRHHAPNMNWPPKGVSLRLDFEMPDKQKKLSVAPKVKVSVHYEMYDGIPLISKWLTVHNPTMSKITVDRFASEILAVVEHSNPVEKRKGVALQKPDSLHVETDFAFGGFSHFNANKHVVHWRSDPQYKTQVNYLRQQPCMLVVEPTYGPSIDVEPNKTWESFRTFILAYDSTERERRGLSLRKMYRTIAPWVTENPLMMHLRNARDPKIVRSAIDQCAEVGFEMVILSFGSGFNIENENPKYLEMWKEIAKYASSKGIEIGGYSLLSSRRIGGGNDIVSPKGERPTHGNCPALTSKWGKDYFRKLYQFYEKTGFRLLEHDGSYPGDVDVTARPPYQKGINDSRWVQWRVITNFYKWCRSQGVYLNVPDYYFLSGANKCGMGYREVNWSLPRAQQVIHTRQNIYDGTWKKTPTMGWMFIPLTQYHGGGAAATIEPLDQHLGHYQQMMSSNLALGVQACYRGPRLYDTDRTKTMVKKQVDWFKKYRGILESDVIHGRRADGRDVDWMLHVNPQLKNKGMLVVFNPLDQKVEKKLRVNLYYTGLNKQAIITNQTQQQKTYPIDRKFNIEIPLSIKPHSMVWFVIQ